MKNFSIIFFCVFIASCSTSQSKITFQKREIFDVEKPIDTNVINGFKPYQIWDEGIDNTVWVSPEKHCVTLELDKKTVYKGNNSLHLKWDKIEGGCAWLGIGFGWNNWQPKDMNLLIDETAIQMKVRANSGSFKNFPVAFALEDYTGVQSYYGFTPKLTQGIFTDSTWQTVLIPLKLFPFEKNEANTSLIKQFIIQLEGDGNIYLDDLKLVRYESK